jgi:hypothetical protein
VSLASAAGYGNFHAGGVVVTIVGDDNFNASVSVEWRPTGGTFRLGHAAPRIDPTHFAGSLFWLSPGTSYEARLTLSDPDGVTGPATTVVTFQTRADTLPAPTLRALYVSTAGNDGNPGTNPAAPLRHIQRAADLSLPGDLISIQPGVYRESVSVTRSGTASQPIVYRGAATGVILDGADEAIAGGAAWTAVGGGVYSRVLGFPTGHVVIEAGRLFRYGTLAALQALGAGAPGGFYFDGTTLFVKFPDGSAPSAHAMNVARFEDGFFVNMAANVRIESVEIRYFGAGDFGRGVYLRYAADCTVKACKIHEVGAAGVWIKGGDRHRVEDNEISDTSIFGWPWDFTKGSSAENDGVLFTDDVGRGNVVRRNTIHGTFNGVGACGSLPPPSGVTSEIDLYENVLYQHTDDAFEPEGYCANVRIWGNQIRDVHMAIAAAPAAPGPLFVVRNVAYRVGNTRTSQVDGYLASALKINSDSATPVGPLFVYHNTFLTSAPNTDAVALLNPGTGTFILALNNVLAGTRYALYKVNPIVWTGNGNDLYTTDPTRLVSWLGVRYNTLAAYRVGVPGQEPQGISALPQLVNPPGGDFSPLPGSLLVDHAVPIAGINDGYRGPAPDIGAFELDLPAISIADAAVAEGNTGTTTNAIFAVSLSAPSASLVSVSYATADGSATAGSDYGIVIGTLTFPPGTIAQPITVPVTGDRVFEGNETFVVNLGGPVNATIADGQGLGTIVDDDLPGLSINNVTAVEGTTAAFTVTLAPVNPTQTVTVNYTTANGTASAGSDYQLASGTLTFPPGTATRPIGVVTSTDSLVEGAETFFVNLSGAVNAAIVYAQGTGTILDKHGGGDFNGDGKPDILWRHQATGDDLVWLMNGTTLAGGAVLTAVTDTTWTIAGTADFNADGKTDVLWRNTANGANLVWLMNGTTVASGVVLTAVSDPNWRIAATGDFNADGKPDIVWRHQTSGDNLVWIMNGTTIASGAVLTPIADTSWVIGGVGDFNSDGKPDILWRNQATGDNLVWLMNGTTIASGAVLTPIGDRSWQIRGVGDFNGDGKPDILWRNQTSGDDLVWLMNGTTIASGTVLTAVTDTSWRIVGPR